MVPGSWRSWKIKPGGSANFKQPYHLIQVSSLDARVLVSKVSTNSTTWTMDLRWLQFPMQKLGCFGSQNAVFVQNLLIIEFSIPHFFFLFWVRLSLGFLRRSYQISNLDSIVGNFMELWFLIIRKVRILSCYIGHCYVAHTEWYENFCFSTCFSL